MRGQYYKQTMRPAFLPTPLQTISETLINHKTTTQSKRVKSAQLTCDDTSEEKHGVVQQQINLRTIMIVDKEYGIHEDTGYLFNKDNQVFGIWKGHGVCNLTEEDKTYLRRRLIKYVDKAVDDAQ